MRKKATKKARRVAEHKPHHHGDLKAALLRAASEYLKTGSAADISLRDLARQAGVSQAAPYRHFRDKHDLIAAIATEGFRQLASSLMRVVFEFEKDPAEQLYQAGIAYFRVGQLHPEHFKLMHGPTMSKSQFEFYPELYLEAQRSFYSLVKVVMNNQQKGLIGSGSVITRAMHCMISVHGFTEMYLNGRLTWLGVEGDFAESALRGLMMDLLEGMKRNHEALMPFSVCAKPTPSLVFQELGLSAADFPDGTVELFDSSQPWPFEIK